MSVRIFFIRPAGPKVLTICTAVALSLATGCSGSSGSSDGQGTAGNPRTTTAADTGFAREPDFPPGKFTVQLGAYQSEDAARKISTLAGSRFSRQIFTVYDAVDGLYKVMLGMFDTKDQARDFRDMIVRQYAGDYRDAWVSDLTR